MKNKLLKHMSIMLILALLLAGCAQKAPEESKTNPMQYISKEDLKSAIESESDEIIILDVRKVEDYDKGHIVGAFAADVDAANKGGDDAKGIEHLKAALKDATGNELGASSKKYALICYSGKSYAQKATDLLLEMGVSADQIYTLEGGMKDWTEAGDEYNNLITN